MYRTKEVASGCIRAYVDIIFSSTGGTSGKESACQYSKYKKLGFDPSGRSPGAGNGNPLQYPCLENSMDRGVHGSQRVGHNWVTEHIPHLILFFSTHQNLVEISINWDNNPGKWMLVKLTILSS